MIDLPDKSSRPPPDVARFKKGDGTIDHDRLAKENSDYLRREIDRLWAALREIQRATPGDRSDFVRVKSDGHGIEVAVPHGMALRPDSYDVASQNGTGHIVPSRDKLADDERAYFKVLANKGVSFRVRLYSTADSLDTAPDDPILEDE